jgi:hypothetical protein
MSIIYYTKKTTKRKEKKYTLKTFALQHSRSTSRKCRLKIKNGDLKTLA